LAYTIDRECHNLDDIVTGKHRQRTTPKPYNPCEPMTDIHTCYQVNSCFWHSKVNKCEMLRDYAKIDTTTTRRPRPRPKPRRTTRQPLYPKDKYPPLEFGCDGLENRDLCLRVKPCEWRMTLRSGFGTCILPEGSSYNGYILPEFTDQNYGGGGEVMDNPPSPTPAETPAKDCKDEANEHDCERLLFEGLACIWRFDNCEPSECEDWANEYDCTEWDNICYWDKNDEQCQNWSLAKARPNFPYLFHSFFNLSINTPTQASIFYFCCLLILYFCFVFSLRLRTQELKSTQNSFAETNV